MTRASILVVAVWFCGSALAADCEGVASCAEQDETSLLQKTLKVHERNDERIPNEAAGWSTPVTNDNAIANSMPAGVDYPAVMDAFGTNAEKTRDVIEAKAADRITFANEQRVERKNDYKQAADAVAADKKALSDEAAADKAAVQETLVQRQDAKDRAARLVKMSKENAMALGIKASQAEAAAALGRKVGEVQGADAARQAWNEYGADVAAEETANRRKAAADRIAKREAAVRAAVEKQTASMKSAEDDAVAEAGRESQLAVAQAAAQGAIKRTQISGPEGLKNRLVEEKAEMATKHYDRDADAEQARIDAAASGNYPDGDWPIGPGDAPGAADGVFAGAADGIFPGAADGSIGEEAAIDDAAGWGGVTSSLA